MKDTLKEGLTFEFQYKIPEDKTVPHLYPEFEEGQTMPKVFATGFLVGLIEFTCIKAIKPHIDPDQEQSVGIGISDLAHTAATPPGFTVTVNVKLEKMEGKKLTFSFEAHDGVDSISKGTHERFIINPEKFNAALAKKMEKKSE